MTPAVIYPAKAIFSDAADSHSCTIDRTASRKTKNGQLLTHRSQKEGATRLQPRALKPAFTRDPQKLLSAQKPRSDAVHSSIVKRTDAETH